MYEHTYDNMDMPPFRAQKGSDKNKNKQNGGACLAGRAVTLLRCVFSGGLSHVLPKCPIVLASLLRVSDGDLR